MEAAMSDKAEKKPEFRSYEPHPHLAFYPDASEEDLKAVEHSVEEYGVREPIVLWVGPGKKELILDGRTRQKAASRAFARAVEEGRPPEAKNGVSLQPDVQHFHGTMDEVWDFVKQRNTRKNYTQGQKAAIATRQYYFEFKKANGIKDGDPLPDIETEVTMPGGLTAEALAEQSGSNVYYIRITKQLYRNRSDLLDAVALNATTPKDAKATMDRDEAARKNPDGGDGKGAPEPPGDPDIPRDANSNPVPESLHAAFRTRGAAKATLRHLSTLEKSVEAIVKSDGGAHLNGPEILKLLRTVGKRIKGGIPHVPCKSCKARGKNLGRDCKRCNVTGYVCKDILKAEEKAKVATAGAGTPAGKADEE